jgi:hypothetical protein
MKPLAIEISNKSLARPLFTGGHGGGSGGAGGMPALPFKSALSVGVQIKADELTLVPEKDLRSRTSGNVFPVFANSGKPVPNCPPDALKAKAVGVPFKVSLAVPGVGAAKKLPDGGGKKTVLKPSPKTKAPALKQPSPATMGVGGGGGGAKAAKVVGAGTVPVAPGGGGFNAKGLSLTKGKKPSNFTKPVGPVVNPVAAPGSVGKPLGGNGLSITTPPAVPSMNKLGVKLGAKSPAVVAPENMTPTQLVTQLKAFYQVVDASKIPTIAKILAKYKGKEAKLFTSLAKKYPAQAHLLSGGGGTAGATGASPAKPGLSPGLGKWGGLGISKTSPGLGKSPAVFAPKKPGAIGGGVFGSKPPAAGGAFAKTSPFAKTSSPLMSGGGGGGGAMTVEQRLNTFYQQVDQSKIQTIPAIVQKYRGQEARLFASLAKKYPAQAHLLNDSGGGGGGGGGGGNAFATKPSPQKFGGGGTSFTSPQTKGSPFGGGNKAVFGQSGAKPGGFGQGAAKPGGFGQGAAKPGGFGQGFGGAAKPGGFGGMKLSGGGGFGQGAAKPGGFGGMKLSGGGGFGGQKAAAFGGGGGGGGGGDIAQRLQAFYQQVRR